MLKKSQRDSQYPEHSDTFEETSLPSVPETMSSGLDDGTRTAWRREPMQNPGGGEQKPEFTAEQPKSRMESVVDADSSVDGKYETQKDLRIFGAISGEVVCRGQLTIEREATAKARIQAHDMVIRGRVEGELTCSGKLTIDSSAVVNATIRTATLVVQEGATVSGNVDTVGGEAPPVVAAARSRKETSGQDEEAPATSRSARGRDLPSFALVSSEDRATDRNAGNGR